jgi:predicted dehydrogenase
MTKPHDRPAAEAADFPASMAIAGAWGYIGRKFLDVALAQGLQTYVFDPGPAPTDVDLARLTRVTDEEAFYGLDADLFHLAVHPEHRRLDRLLERPQPLLILSEKPMAEPGRADECRRIIAAANASPSITLYDFPELFDPLTARLLDLLAQFKSVRLTEIYVQRSKDREDPGNPRNYKRMVPIQYQESVHCFAFALYVTAAVQGSLDAALAGGVRVTGEADLYEPPNPDAYPEPVDGRCRFQAMMAGVRVTGYTDFKRHAPWAKRRLVRGTGDGVPFEVDLSYLEGHKHLRLNGAEQPCDPGANSYAHVLTTAKRWARQVDREGLMAGLFPNPRFTYATYRFSSALWQSCRGPTEIAVAPE